MRRMIELLIGITLIAIPQLSADMGISGRVTSAPTGLPIRGAMVVASGANGSGTAESDSAGNYVMLGLLHGKYRVICEANDFVTQVFRESVLVRPESVVRHIDFALEPVGGHIGGITGMIYDAHTRDPIPGAYVLAVGPAGQGNAGTGSAGMYEIVGLPAGRYRVRAEADGYLSGAYPESVTVVAGQITPNICIGLEPHGVTTGGISGRVTSARTELPIRGAIVVAFGLHGSGTAQTESCGGYTLRGLPAGRYQVRAEAAGYESAVFPESVTVIEGQTTPDINFRLEPRGGGTGGISGVVINSVTRAPIVGARVVTEGPSRGQANTGERGGYYIGELLPGEYVAQASAPGYQPAMRYHIAVEAGNVTRDVDFVLEPIGGEVGCISGVILDSATAAPIRGAVIAATGRTGSGTAESDSTGHYRIMNLPAGAYHVRSEARGYYPATFPEPVEVVGGRNTEHIDFNLVCVRLLDAGIGGCVYDGTAQTGISGALVVATGPNTGQCVTDAEGDYLLTGLEPGEYRISVYRSGYEPGSCCEPVLVEDRVITAFCDPWLYPSAALEESHLNPARLTLSVAPNPASGPARITYTVPVAGPVRLDLYDVSGKLVMTLDQGHLTAGTHVVTIGHSRVARGLYLLRLETGTGSATRKLLVD